MEKLRLPFLTPLVFTLVSIFGIGYLAILGQSILAPLICGFLLASLFLPLASWLEDKLRFKRILATTFCFILLMLSIFGISYFFLYQISDFFQDLPILEHKLVYNFQKLQLWVREEYDIRLPTQMTYLEQGLNRLLASSAHIIGLTLSIFSSSLGFIAFTLLFFFFILNFRRTLRVFLVSVFRKEHSLQVVSVLGKIKVMVRKYVSGLFIQILLVTLMTTLTLSFMEVRYALLLGVLTGLLNVIPYVGILVSCLLTCMISFITGTGSPLWIIVAYMVIHAIDANVVLPLIVGSRVKINPLISFIALLIGQHMWGISGMFLSIPVFAVLKIIFEHVENLQPWAILMGEEAEKD